MTNEENKRRSTDANVNYIKSNICDRTGNESYVFISYKSDDWETVLHDVVYRLVKDYGLNVYFDGSFDSHNSLWINQFPENMGDYKCKGVIAFFDDKYATSYATLMELLYSQTKKAAMGKANPNGLPIVPIDLAKLTNITGEQGQKDTGLGVDTYEDGSVNVNAASEMDLFSKSFRELVQRHILDDAQYIWEPKERLNAMTCSQIVREIKAFKRINENYYSPDMSLDGIVGSIKNACGAEVFNQNKKQEVKIQFISGNRHWSENIKKGDCISQPDPGENDGYDFKGWFSSITGSEWDFNNPVEMDMEITARWEEAILQPNSDGYVYSIFGKEYTAGSREQGKLMYDAFDALIKRYPDSAERLTQRTSISRAEDVKDPGTKDANPPYFRGYKSFSVNGNEYLVGTSYGFNAKIAEIKGMFNICGVDASEFILNGSPLVGGGKKSGGRQLSSGVGDADSGFKYTLWGIPHTANKMSDMMHDVFDLIAQKYPGKVPDMADDESITSVARKDDVDNGKLLPNKMNYFKAKKEHSVDGILYYVSTRYNREQGVGQLEKMLVLCEGNSEGFKITVAPDKNAHSVSKSGKKGIGELFNE